VLLEDRGRAVVAGDDVADLGRFGGERLLSRNAVSSMVA